ncbi:MAG: hypothetical protein WDO24_15955 [Pseudomonadota bacterium]
MPGQARANLLDDRVARYLALFEIAVQPAGRHAVVGFDLADHGLDVAVVDLDAFGLGLLQLQPLVDQVAQDLREHLAECLGRFRLVQGQEQQPDARVDVEQRDHLVIDDRGDAQHLLGVRRHRPGEPPRRQDQGHQAGDPGRQPCGLPRRSIHRSVVSSHETLPPKSVVTGRRRPPGGANLKQSNGRRNLIHCGNSARPPFPFYAAAR